MAQVDQKLEDFLIGNFEKLPRDVVGVIAAQIDRESLLNLCLSNKRFLGYCQSSKWFDQKILQYIEERAPLSGHFRSLEEQADLIEKGFKTCYYANIKPEDEETWFAVEAVFVSENTKKYVETLRSQVVKFEIVGLPPAKGTKVWLLARINRKTFNPNVLYPNEYSEVFLTKQEAVDYLRTRQGKSAFEIDNDHIPYYTHEEMIDALAENGGVEFQLSRTDHRYHFLLEVTLP